MKSRSRIAAAPVTAVLMLGVLGTGPAYGASLAPGECRLSDAVPAPSPTDPQADFNRYSWQLFVALNWPAKADDRGVPDCSKAFGSSSDTVWRSYKFVDEVFLPGARNPGPWNSTPPGVVLTNTAKASKVVQASGVLASVMQPVGGWLIDQHGNPTYYQIAIDKTSYDYVVANDLYNADVANEAKDLDFPWGALEIKASWRILTGVDDKSRYLHTTATVETYDADGKTQGTTQATIGLVGLHVLNKPRGFPQWIWSTFEQVDNVTAPPNGKASYFDPDAPAPDVNKSPCAGNRSPCTPRPGRTFQTPDPLTRVTPVPAETVAVNTDAQAALAGTFGQFYELVDTQWPTDPDDPGNPLGTPQPNILANTTMESYIQPTSSCMACHSTAVTGPNRLRADFSFIFIHAYAP